MKIKTSELEGAALDWATGVSLGHKVQHSNNVGGLSISEPYSRHDRFIWSPSTDWSQGGPLIDKHGISFATVGTGPRDANGKEPVVSIISGVDGGIGQGATHLIAACRAIVAAELGDSVDVPDELVPE